MWCDDVVLLFSGWTRFDERLAYAYDVVLTGVLAYADDVVLLFSGWTRSVKFCVFHTEAFFTDIFLHLSVYFLQD
jgi:hypothetical protein